MFKGLEEELADWGKFSIEVCHRVMDGLQGAGFTPSDRAAFEKVIWFITLLGQTPTENFSGYVTTLMQQPDGDQWFAHYINQGKSLERCNHLLSRTPETGWLPEPLRNSFTLGSTPVSDLHFVSQCTWEDDFIGGYEQTTVTLMARAIEEEILQPSFVSSMAEEMMTEHHIKEVVSLMLSVSDVMPQIESFDLISSAMHSLRAVDPATRYTIYGDHEFEEEMHFDEDRTRLSMSNAEEFAQQSSLFRFLLTSKQAATIFPTMAYNWVGETPRHDEAWAELIKSCSSAVEVDVLVRYYDTRGGDAAAAAQYMRERPAASLGDAWL